MRGRTPPQGIANSLSAYARLIAVTTLTEMAGRPGVLRGTGPVDPALARDLANAAAQNPKTTWCVTVTDEQRHAIGHGCARPEPRSHARRRDKPGKPGPPGGPDPPPGTSSTPGPGFSFTARGQHGPPGGYGTWTLRTTANGPDLIVALDLITTGGCDVMAGLSAGTTIGLSSTPSGRSISFPMAPSNGPPHPGASTPPNPPATPSNTFRHRRTRHAGTRRRG